MRGFIERAQGEGVVPEHRFDSVPQFLRSREWRSFDERPRRLQRRAHRLRRELAPGVGGSAFAIAVASAILEFHEQIVLHRRGAERNRERMPHREFNVIEAQCHASCFYFVRGRSMLAKSTAQRLPVGPGEKHRLLLRVHPGRQREDVAVHRCQAVVDHVLGRGIEVTELLMYDQRNELRAVTPEKPPPGVGNGRRRSRHPREPLLPSHQDDGLPGIVAFDAHRHVIVNAAPKQPAIAVDWGEQARLGGEIAA